MKVCPWSVKNTIQIKWQETNIQQNRVKWREKGGKEKMRRRIYVCSVTKGTLCKVTPLTIECRSIVISTNHKCHQRSTPTPTSERDWFKVNTMTLVNCIYRYDFFVTMEKRKKVNCFIVVSSRECALHGKDEFVQEPRISLITSNWNWVSEC